MQAHHLYIDQQTGIARAGTTGNALPSPFAILGTTLVLKVGFLTDGVPAAIANYTASSLQASVKLKTDLDSEISLLPEGAWSVEGVGAATRYVWTVLAESDELLTAIGDASKLDVVIGIKWGITGDANRKSFPIDLQIINSPIRSGDGSPGAVPDRYWLWLKDSIEGSENVELQYDEVNKVITIVVDVPDVAIADGDKGDVIVSGGGTVWSLDDECVIESKIGPGAVTFAKMQVLNASELIGRAAGGGSGVPRAITLGAGLSMSVGGVLSASISDGDKGDITVTGGVWSIDNSVITLSKMANLAASTLVGRQSTGTGAPQAITLGSGLSMSAGGVLSSSVADGDKGDITVTGGVWSIDNSVITLSKMANLAASTLVGRQSTGTGTPQAITLGSGLSMSASGVLSATGGGGGAAPLVTRIIYVDPTGTSPSAGIGTGTAMSDFKQAYEAAVSYINSNPGAGVTLHLSAGMHSATNLIMQPSYPIHIQGEGASSTFLTITNSGIAEAFIFGAGFTLLLSITGNDGTAGDAGTYENPSGTAGTPGQEISGGVVGCGGYIRIGSITVQAGNGGPGGTTLDLGGMVWGADAGSGGNLTFRCINVERTSGDWYLSAGSGGTPGSGAGGGGAGATSPGYATVRFANVINADYPVPTGNVTVLPSSATVYAQSCHFGTLNGANWTANDCRYLSTFVSLDDAGGAPNYPYTAGI